MLWQSSARVMRCRTTSEDDEETFLPPFSLLLLWRRLAGSAARDRAESPSTMPASPAHAPARKVAESVIIPTDSPTIRAARMLPPMMRSIWASDTPHAARASSVLTSTIHLLSVVLAMQIM